MSASYRQLEAIVRISESLAKIRMAPFAVEGDVDEALRLFKASTMEAASSGSLAGKISRHSSRGKAVSGCETSGTVGNGFEMITSHSLFLPTVSHSSFIPHHLC